MSDDEYATLVAQLASVPRDGDAVSIRLVGDLGRYRLVAVPRPYGAVVVGLPLTDVDAFLVELIGLEALLALLAVAGAVVAARVVVIRSLRPLNRVAATAQQVSQLKLDRGEVALAVRVPAADADPTSEVGRVGQAFNHMLNNVEEALAARQASETRVRQFVADASHELRNPLAAIRGLCRADPPRAGPVAGRRRVRHGPGGVGGRPDVPSGRGPAAAGPARLRSRSGHPAHRPQ